ncbi:MAG: lysophospholipid acyltransferase family protein [Kiritimatiellia bacterium]
MFRTILFHLLFWIEQVCTLPWLVYGLWLERRGHTARLRSLAARRNRIWSRLQLAWGGVRVRVHGAVDVPPGRGAVVVSNHQGAFDIPILGSCLGRDVAFIAKIELARVPIAGTWMRFMGCQFINRSDRRQSLAVFKAAGKLLQEGAWIVIFPEGTRSHRQEMAPFKKGSVSLAVKAGVPVVPVAISNSWKIQAAGMDPIRPGTVDLHILPSIDPARLSPPELDDLSEKVQAEIAAKLAP